MADRVVFVRRIVVVPYVELNHYMLSASRCISAYSIRTAHAMVELVLDSALLAFQVSRVAVVCCAKDRRSDRLVGEHAASKQEHGVKESGHRDRHKSNERASSRRRKRAKGDEQCTAGLRPCKKWCQGARCIRGPGASRSQSVRS